MATLPERLGRVIWWVKVRVPVWRQDPAFIGLDEATIDELEALADEAAQLRIAYAGARSAARAAGATYRQRARTLRKQAAHAAERVRTHAAGQPQPADVLVAARLRTRSKPSPTPAPGKPIAFTAQLDESGWITCKFVCKNDRSLRGVTYLVERSLGHDGAFEFLTLARGRAFTDKSVPPGTPRATYRVTAQTSTKSGPPAEHTVRLGSADVPAAARHAA